jgi:HK97 gp10 family phage protein
MALMTRTGRRATEQTRVDFRSNFKEVGELVQKASRKSIRKGLRVVARDAKTLCPVSSAEDFRTGRTWRKTHYPDVHMQHTRDSIKTQVRGERGNRARTVGKIFTTSGIGAYVETGTAKMPAQPFMRPALEKNKDKFVDILKADVAQGGRKLELTKAAMK